QAALDEAAARDRDLLQELLLRFAAAYADAKGRESALDFEDLQLHARNLLRDNPSIREREGLRFRSIMVDEFQDTNRLQCELVDTGVATASEIVLLFAAGTDAEWYEDELRKAGLPTYRATGKGYFGQQQVVDLLAYLRLLHNRYDDRAVLTVLASPFVGLSND